MTDKTHIALTVPAYVDMALITGPGDNLLRIIQSAFHARVNVRGDIISLEGDPTEVQSLTVLFSDLIKLVEEGGKPDADYIRHALELLRADEYSPQALREDILLTYRGRAVRPKTAGQKRYVDAIRANTITFGVGPAGTGKTYLAMAMAVAALKRKEVGRIILTRPVVEAGESLGFLPGTALAVFGMMAGSALLTVVGGVVGGLVGGPFLSGMIDTVLRALRDEPGYWWNTYKRAWKQNWRQSLVPGALLGLFVGSWAWMLRAQAESGNTSTALWVASFAGIFVCTGFFTWLLAQVPLVDLPLVQIAKNAGLMFFGFFPRTAAAALVLALYWGATLLYLPATILTILAFGFWLPVTIALMIVYPGLEKVFKLEETINARRAAEIEERMAQNQPKFDQ